MSGIIRPGRSTLAVMATVMFTRIRDVGHLATLCQGHVVVVPVAVIHHHRTMTARVAAHGDTLSLRYALRLRDGTEILSNFDDPEPDTLTLGDGTLAPNLEQWLIGLAVGERHVFLLDPEQAFGVSQPDLIHNLPRAEVETGEPLQVTGLVEFTTADGQTLTGQILEIGEETVRVDFNHPLADLPIEFEIEIVQLHESVSSGTPS